MTKGEREAGVLEEGLAAHEDGKLVNVHVVALRQCGVVGVVLVENLVDAVGAGCARRHFIRRELGGELRGFRPLLARLALDAAGILRLASGLFFRCHGSRPSTRDTRWVRASERDRDRE